MKLSRRDALAVLAGGTILTGGGIAAFVRSFGDDDPEASLAELQDALVAAAEVTYPSEVDGVEAFVRTYAEGRLETRTDYARAARYTLDDLNDYARTVHDADFLALDATTQATALSRVGADTAEPVPDGSTAERVRYYLVNDVLYALYSSPTGAGLVGLENPQGYAGGTGSYRTGPDGETVENGRTVETAAGDASGDGTTTTTADDGGGAGGDG
jgi:hypothetical protein